MDLKTKIANLPKRPGIYKFLDKKGKVIYIGKSISIKDRVSSYFQDSNLSPKTKLLVSKVADLDYIEVFSDFEALLLESELISQYKPFFNVIAKDDKSPIYIKITKDKIPLLTLTRRKKREKSVFLKGPFPSVKKTLEVLRIVRRIFPYCHHKNPKKPCLFVHLGLCPYPYKSEEAKKEYLKTINKIKKLLRGKNKALLNQLSREMKFYAKKEEFESAQAIKRQIEEIGYLFSTFRQPSEFINQPNLVDDVQKAKILDLKKQLKLSKIPRRIESYDISNISGTLSTGSMVVFLNGYPGKNQYRRFKIRSKKGPNDYKMIKEVLTRRFRNDWPLPDLIIIDGGKGQLNIALEVINNLGLDIPAISIAKRLEKIYTSGSLKPLALNINSPARQLVQTTRDEAHRFAISYHKLLRSKNLLDALN